GARVDLRVGALAAGVIRPRGAPADTFAYSTLTRLLRGARMAWRERGAFAGLSLALPAEMQRNLDPALLSEAAIEAGCTRPLCSFPLDERAVVRTGRAQGWGVSLRADSACPLPLGERARALYSEIVLDCPSEPGPYFGLEGGDCTPLAQRVLAARAAGIILTAEIVNTPAQARRLAMAGFNRGGGPFAEAGLR
ncbi:MAG: hypothetical protein ABL883_15265, partial [Terricaulis sp.]